MTWDNRIDTSEARAAVHAAADVGLERVAAHILAASNAIIPIDTGELMRSGRAGLTGRRHEAAVTYRAPSAVPAHEKVDVPAGNGRQRKYLETAFNRERATAGELLAAAIREAVGR